MTPTTPRRPGAGTAVRAGVRAAVRVVVRPARPLRCVTRLDGSGS